MSQCVDPLVGKILAGWRYDISGLAPEMRVDYEAHLAECQYCGTYLEQMRETIRLSGMVTEEQVPEDEKTALLAAFRDWRS